MLLKKTSEVMQLKAGIFYFQLDISIQIQEANICNSTSPPPLFLFVCGSFLSIAEHSGICCIFTEKLAEESEVGGKQDKKKGKEKNTEDEKRS